MTSNYKTDSNGFFCIASFSSYFNSVFIDKSFISIFKTLSDSFDEEFNETIKYLEKHHFYYDEKEIENSKFFFYKSSNYLKSLENNKVVYFNDLDNSATFLENDNFEFIEFTSQNVVYIHSRNKHTGVIKVWNSCIVSKNLELGYLKKNSSTYIEAFQNILLPYSYNRYPIEVLAEGYSKSIDYYMKNLESDYYIIFDSTKGFNLKSIHSGNLLDDFRLLLSALDDIIKFG